MDNTQYYIQFRRGPKEDKPYFSVKQKGSDSETTVTRVTGTLQGVFYNQEQEKAKKDGGTFTAPENFVIRLTKGDNTYNVQVDVQSGQQLRPMLNSLLNTEIGDELEIATYIAKGKYKVISVTNPTKRKKIEFEKDGETKTAEVNEAYPWKFQISEIPEVEVTRNKKDEVVDVDDSEANKFFKEKILEKFSNREEGTAVEKADTPQKAEAKEEVSVEDLPF